MLTVNDVIAFTTDVFSCRVVDVEVLERKSEMCEKWEQIAVLSNEKRFIAQLRG